MTMRTMRPVSIPPPSSAEEELPSLSLPGAGLAVGIAVGIAVGLEVVGIEVGLDETGDSVGATVVGDAVPLLTTALTCWMLAEQSRSLMWSLPAVPYAHSNATPFPTTVASRVTMLAQPVRPVSSYNVWARRRVSARGCEHVGARQQGRRAERGGALWGGGRGGPYNVSLPMVVIPRRRTDFARKRGRCAVVSGHKAPWVSRGAWRGTAGGRGSGAILTHCIAEG